MFNRESGRVLWVFVCAFVLFVLMASSAETQQPVLQYAVKFVCGIPGLEAEREAVKPGNYATAINLHNPVAGPLRFRKKAVRALPQGFEPIPPSPFTDESIGPDFALEVDCQNIRELLSGPPAPEFITGFLVLEIPFGDLDVWAVYTAQPPGSTGGMTLDVETNIRPRQVVPATEKNSK